MGPQDTYERILDTLHEAMLDDARWPAASALIDEACGSKGNVIMTAAGERTSEVNIFLARACYRGERLTEIERRYFGLYYPRDEGPPRMRQMPDSRIVHIRELYTDEEIRTSAVYNEFLPDADLLDGLVTQLEEPHGLRIILVLADPVDRQGRTSERLRTLARLLPHLRQYVRVRTALADAGALAATAAELLDNARAGVIQLDPRGRIVGANDSARALLARNDGLSEQAGELRAVTPPDSARLQQLLARALPRFGEQPESGSMMLKTSSRLPRFALHVKPVAEREADYRCQGVAALVLIVDPVNRARIEPALVAAVLGLTPAEAEVAVLLAQGLTVRQIAAATGRSYSTLRTHLKHIFAKLRVSRQYEVAQLVLSLAGLPVSGE